MIAARRVIPAALCAAALLAGAAGAAEEKSGEAVLKLEDFTGTWTGKTKFQDMDVRLVIDAAGNVAGGAMGSHGFQKRGKLEIADAKRYDGFTVTFYFSDVCQDKAKTIEKATLKHALDAGNEIEGHFANPCFPPSSGWIRLKRTSTAVEPARAVAPGIEALTLMNTVYKPEGWTELARAAGAAPEELAKAGEVVAASRKRALANRDWCMGEWKKGNRPLEQCVANLRAIRKEFLEKLAGCLDGRRAGLVAECAALGEEFEKEAAPLARTLQDKQTAAADREAAAARYRELQKSYGEKLGRKLSPAPAGASAPAAVSGGGGEDAGGSCCPAPGAR